MKIFAFDKQLKENEKISEGDLTKLKGKSIYSKYQKGDKILFFIIKDGNNFIIKTITDKEIDKLNKDYKFVRISNDLPIFKMEV